MSYYLAAVGLSLLCHRTPLAGAADQRSPNIGFTVGVCAVQLGHAGQPRILHQFGIEVESFGGSSGLSASRRRGLVGAV